MKEIWYSLSTTPAGLAALFSEIQLNMNGTVRLVFHQGTEITVAYTVLIKIEEAK